MARTKTPTSHSSSCKQLDLRVEAVTAHAHKAHGDIRLASVCESPITATDLSRVLDRLIALGVTPREFSVSLSDPAVAVTMRLGRLVASRSVAEVDLLLDAWNARMTVKPGRCIQTIAKHTNRVTGVAVLPDQTMVTAAWDGRALLWGLCGCVTMEHKGVIHCVAASPDGTAIATGGPTKKSLGAIKLWQAETGRRIATLKGHTGEVISAAFSTDGKWLASGSDDETVRLWHAASGDCVKTLVGHANVVCAVVFSPSGRTVVSGSADQTVRVWDVATGRLEQTLEGHTRAVSAAAFTPDGALLASGSHDRTIRLWDTRTWECVCTLPAHTEPVHALAFSPDGTALASGGEDYCINMWSISSGECFQSLEGHTHCVTSIAFSQDGQTLVSGSHDRSVKLWSIGGSLQVERESTQAEAMDDSVVRLHAEELEASLTPEDLSRVLDRLIALGVTPREFSVSLSDPAVAVTMRLGRLVASRSVAEVDLLLDAWNARMTVKPGRCIQTIAKHTNRVTGVAVLPDQTMVTAAWDGRALLWGLCGCVTMEHKGVIHCVAASPDGTAIATGGPTKKSLGAIKLWQAETGRRIATLKGHTGEVISAAFSTDGKWLASGSDDETVRLWHAASGDCVKTLVGHANVVCAVVFSPSGRTVVSGSADQTVRVWDVATGRLEQTLEGHTRAVSAAAFTPDGALLASGSHDRTIRLWDTRTWDFLHTFQGHDHWVTCVAFSPTNTMLASGSADKTVKIWSMIDGSCLLTLAEHIEGVTGVTFMTASMCLALVSTASDDTIKSWFISRHSASLSAEFDNVCAVPAAGGHIHLVSDGSPVTDSDLARILLHILATGLPHSFYMELTRPSTTVTLSRTGFVSSRRNTAVDSMVQTANGWPVLKVLAAANKAADMITELDTTLYDTADLRHSEQLLTQIEILLEAAGQHAEQHQSIVSGMRADLIRLSPVLRLRQDPMRAVRGRVEDALERSDWLNDAVISGDIRKVKSKPLLRSRKFKRIIVNCLDWEGRSPLFNAFENDQPEAFATLIKAGCLLEGSFPDGHPLLAAVAKPAMLDAMLKAKVDINTVSRNTTALVVAILGGHQDSAMKLLARGADPLLPPVGTNAIQALKAVADPVMSGLIRDGINTNLTGQLLRAISKADTAVVRRLLSASTPVRGVPSMMPPLFAAAKAGNYDIVSLLLRYGADRTAVYKRKKVSQVLKRRSKLRQLLMKDDREPLVRPNLNVDITKPAGSITIDQSTCIGVGGMAEVFRGTYGGSQCAVKEVHLANLNEVQADQLQSEIFVHKQLRHRNVIALYALEQGEQTTRIALELASGSLSALLLSNSHLPWDARLKFARDIAAAMAFMVGEGYEHRDLKSLNVLVANDTAKISDFGLTARLNERTDVEGSWPWMAPERFDGVGGEKADVFAFGITLWEIAARDIPYRQERLGLDAIRDHVRAGYRPTIPADTPMAVNELIRRCMAQDQRDRPTFADIVAILPDTVSTDMYTESAVRSNEVATFAGASAPVMTTLDEAPRVLSVYEKTLANASAPWLTLSADEREAALVATGPVTATYRLNASDATVVIEEMYR
ncbi:Protein tyrosine kinase [Carpediemonas membranifera]|uniref:Protein tyrosine kinase n=1 Tax=Carpediemonas membranifera TaxID=201153 RepID=A0A8J6E3M4_9EUKA|nr:Protein tyrosine kinase [Carpediemonas membranifera]|eukprot:KAG9395786.1 Protein tyrosine kinase [Carpediemonas membranifera]